MPDESRRDLHEANRRSWNVATRRHNAHKRDQAKLLREGGEQLYTEDYELLGPLAGKRVVHLQCNSGQDTLCIARRGAAVTGVDISDDAIEFAKALSRDSGIAASFERADIYDWLPKAAGEGRRFDVAYASYGALIWLSDLRRWAAGVAEILAPGGALVVIEFHPFASMFDEQRRLVHPYFRDGADDWVIWKDGVGDYVGGSGDALAPSGFRELDDAYANPHACHEFPWSIARLLEVLLEAGLVLERFAEWPYTNGCRFYDDMVRVDDEDGRRYTGGPGQPKLPMMVGLRARKPAPAPAPEPEGLPMWQIDAFTSARFGGNPAAVCLLDAPLPDATLAAIAGENNLSETAFIRRDPDAPEDPTRWTIRWFTPQTEVDLCGHATLASAFVVLERVAPELERVVFASRSGPLTVTRGQDGRLIMDFPAGPSVPVDVDPAMAAALGATPQEQRRASYDLAVFATEAEVAALQPDFAALRKLPPGEVIATAPADDPELDFVSRFFAPGVGIDEDPVTGSAHCILAPYWGERLGKTQLRARQISSRVGELECVVEGERVRLIGRCVEYARARIETSE